VIEWLLRVHQKCLLSWDDVDVRSQQTTNNRRHFQCCQYRATIDRFDATFDHDGLIANAGLIMIATLMSRLGLERLTNKWIHTGSFAPGRKICTLIAAMVAGATHIDHIDTKHIPSGHYPANAAWFACATIAHNFTRWAVILGKHDPVNNRTLRTRIIAIPAVAANKSGRHTLRFPTNWPWRKAFTIMLNNLRAIPGPAS